MYQADHMVTSHLGKPIFKCATGAFGGITFTPRLPAEDPSELKTWPTCGIEEADSTQQSSGRFLFDRPWAVPFQVPMANDHRHLAPGLPARERPAVAQVPGDMLVTG